MPSTTWTEQDTARSRELWAEYQKTHDVSERLGQAVGIDPTSGRVWFGESATEVVERMNADGVDTPLYFARVGYPTYLRKGGRH